ncbi:MAG: ATP-binding cassette domain-containing protein [Streptosporangiales bacterium]|nr:ATP-binding cassette domain-containing protein [Streptosporangiales bacterium]
MQFYIDIVNAALIVAVLGFSVNLLVGYTGLVSMAQGAVYGVGSYAAAVAATKAGLPFPLTILASIAAATLVSVLMSWPALRVKGEYLILLTLAVQLVLSGVYEAWVPVTGGTSGIAGIPQPAFGAEFPGPGTLLPFVLAVFVVGFGVSLWVGHSPFGRTLRVIREDESAAESVGKHVTYYKVAVFALAGALAGLAGGTYAHYQAFVNPVSFSLDQSIFLMAVVVLGGAGNLFGTVIGAAVLASFPQLLLLANFDNQVAAVAQRFLYGLLLVLFMLYRPQGLVPEYFRLRRRTPGRPLGRDLAEIQITDLNFCKITAKGGSVVLRATDLHKSFDGVKPADGLSMVLPAGRITALVGPNGAGKTTVFNLLTGFVPPDRGRVTLHAEDITHLPTWQRARRGLVRSFQDVRICEGLSVLDNVRTAIPRQAGETVGSLLLAPAVIRARRAHVEAAMSYLEFVGLAGRANEPAAALPFGEHKLLAIARLLATEADVLLLDEPASGVDRAWAERVLDLIRRLADEGKTICLVEHNLDVVRALADRAYFMDAGRIIAEGTPEELMADEHLAAVYFGTRSGRPGHAGG